MTKIVSLQFKDMNDDDKSVALLILRPDLTLKDAQKLVSGEESKPDADHRDVHPRHGS